MATESDNVDTSVLATIAAVTALVTVSVVLAVTALVRSEQSAAVVTKGTTANLRPLRDLRAKQLAVLRAPPAWKDRKTGLVTLPLDRATKRVVEDLVGDPSSATPLASQQATSEGTHPVPGKPSDSPKTEENADAQAPRPAAPEPKNADPRVEAISPG